MDAVEVLSDNLPSLRTYQNQTAEDIESGRARMDSVTSYGSGGSEEALLPDVSFTGNGSVASARLTSPRRTNRENLPLLRGRPLRPAQYEDIDLDNGNVFHGE